MSAPPPSALLRFHRDNNRLSAGNWSHFEGHRGRVTALLEAAAPTAGQGAAGASLAILGAGNCNDLDLAALAARFASIHLVDIDAEAVARARERQPPEVARALVLRAPVDLTGMFDRLPGWRDKALPPALLAGLPRQAQEQVVAAIPERFDAVASVCCLSQLMHSLRLALGPHPQLQLMACVLLLVHVRSMIELLRPGGQALLITDTSSSETYPLEELWDAQSPRALLEHLDRTGNVLSGTSASFVRQTIATDEWLSPRLTGPADLVEPWLWRLSGEVSFLVYALVMQRRSADTG